MKNTYQLKIKRISYDYYGKFDSEKQALEWAVSAKGKKTIGGQTLLNNVEVSPLGVVKKDGLFDN